MQLLCTEALQLFGIHHEHVGCRAIARLSSAFAAIAGVVRDHTTVMTPAAPTRCHGNPSTSARR